jgi:sugar lactone lactonase YvrE
MIEADINESFLSNLTEATPIPPNPTPVATPSISTNYQQTYIQPFHFNKGIVTTIAGTNQYGYLDGSALSSRFRNPQDVVVDKNGNIYIADTSNYKIRKIAPNGTVTTLAGSSSGYVNGQGANAKFRSPTRIAVDSIGNIYVSDTGNHRIRKITPDRTVTTLAGSTNGYADGVGTAAKFYSPSGIAVDSIGNVYVADTGNHRIRKITPDGTVTTLAGTNISDYADGVGENAQFTYLYGIAVDNKGNLFTTEGDSEGGGYHVIRKTTPNGTVTTIAGSTTGDRGYQDGVGTDALFMDPSDLTVDNYGNIYVVDSSNSVIRKIDSNLNVTTLAGNSINGFADGTGSDAKFYYPQGITMDSFGNLYVADASNYRIRKIE